MKRFIISLLLLTGIFALSIFSNLYISANTADMLSYVEEVKSLLEKEDYSNASRLSNELAKKWNTYCEHRMLIIDTQHVLEISDSVTRINALVKQENDDAIIECSVALSLLKFYRNKNSVSLKHIL